MSNLPLPKLLKKAQIVFNAWVRERDAKLGCISCGGVVEQAGHYYSAGHNSSMRFSETNVNGQCIRCNMYLHGNLINYRKGLIRRYGSGLVEVMEGYAERRNTHKWSREELIAIIYKYGKKKGK